jgi:hypothetical protein
MVRVLLFVLLVVAPGALLGWMRFAAHAHPRPDTVTAPGAAAADPDAVLTRSLAAGLPGVTLKAPVALFDRETLFDHINGGAPAYLDRNFRRLAAVELTTADGVDLNVDVYDMTTPRDAQAIHQAERQPSAREVPGWPGCLAASMSLTFVAGRYYVKLVSFDARGEAHLPEVGRAVAGRLP